jgi:hypothetical protein
MAVITFHLPEPLGDLSINIPALDIAKPSDASDPTTTIYTKDYRKTILIKVIREIELLLEEEDLLENNEHILKLRQLFDYPNVKKETFEHFFKMSVSSTNMLFEIYPKYLLPHFINMYTNDTSDQPIVAFHLQFVGTANRHLKNALSLKSTFIPMNIRQIDQTSDISNKIGEGSSPISTLAGEGTTNTTKFEDDDATAPYDVISDELVSDFL